MGFRLGYDGSGTQSAKGNLQSAADYPTIVDDYLHNELLGKISAPYPPSYAPVPM